MWREILRRYCIRKMWQGPNEITNIWKWDQWERVSSLKIDNISTFYVTTSGSLLWFWLFSDDWIGLNQSKFYQFSFYCVFLVYGFWVLVLNYQICMIYSRQLFSWDKNLFSCIRISSDHLRFIFVINQEIEISPDSLLCLT